MFWQLWFTGRSEATRLLPWSIFFFHFLFFGRKKKEDKVWAIIQLGFWFSLHVAELFHLGCLHCPPVHFVNWVEEQKLIGDQEPQDLIWRYISFQKWTRRVYFVGVSRIIKNNQKAFIVENFHFKKNEGFFNLLMKTQKKLFLHHIKE